MGTVNEKNEKGDSAIEVKEQTEEDDDNDESDADTTQKNYEGLTLISRLRDVLKGIMYQEQHVAILTENTNDKTWIQDILRCAKYETQGATSFPVQHIVVDTLENFEGLESPVILFIVPKSWGTGYIGTLKYRLCITTRAISRLEFLVPWDPTGREQDLAELRRAFQTKVSPSHILPMFKHSASV